MFKELYIIQVGAFILGAVDDIAHANEIVEVYARQNITASYTKHRLNVLGTIELKFTAPVHPVALSQAVRAE